VPLPISRTALDRLGKRLSQPDAATEDDYAQLSQVLRVYELALSTVRNQLEASGFEVANRLKTTGTLVEKLRRERGMKLTRVQDVAGARITIAGTRADQDEAVARIIGRITGGVRPAQIRDRRHQPSSGYRAVHVILFPGNLPVEVQVRTELQHVWAQLFEQLGDVWGRDIRYGGQPSQPDAVAIPGEAGPSRAAVVAAMHSMSDVIHRFEISELQSSSGAVDLAVEKAGLLLLLRSTVQLVQQSVGAGREA